MSDAMTGGEYFREQDNITAAQLAAFVTRKKLEEGERSLRQEQRERLHDLLQATSVVIEAAKVVASADMNKRIVCMTGLIAKLAMATTAFPAVEVKGDVT